MEQLNWFMTHWGEIAKCLGELTAAITALATAIIGLASLIVRMIPVLRKNHPALPLVKFLGRVALNRRVEDSARPHR